MNNILGNIIIYLIIGGFTLTGLLSDKYSIAGYDIFDTIIFFTFIISLARNKTIKYYKIDIYLLWFFLFIVIIPIMINLEKFLFLGENQKVIILPIKMYLVYRIFVNFNFSIRINYFNKKIINAIIFFSLIASVIALLRYLGPTIIVKFINNMWPIDQGRGTNPIEYGRLVSTMSGTNGGAAFFSIVAILCFFCFYETKIKIYLYIYIFFNIIVFLTGSLTSILLMSCFICYSLPKILENRNFSQLISVVIIFLAVFFSLNNTDQLLKSIYQSRIQGKLLGERETIMPKNFMARYYRWGDLLKIGMERPIFGHACMAPKTSVPNISLTHNYYVYLFIYSGILGLISYLFFYFKVFKSIFNKKYNDNYFLFIIIFILIAQTTQLTSHYGGISELLGILFYLNRYNIT
ncbi:uncharacterized protein Dvar_36920 [Desulfosarcina variabilis str. Montpellier]|uniref:O-antigen ligase family protein n=1 Tax=Desulfosarcina variabilis TaxID=2300 RepID=UPI003AFA7F2C